MNSQPIKEWRVAPALHWSEAFALWLKQTPTAKRRERGQATLSAYAQDTRLFCAWFEKHIGQSFSPELLNETDIKAYFAGIEVNSKPATYNRKLASMNMLCNWARMEGVLEGNPTAWIPSLDATRESPRDVAASDFALLAAVAESGKHLSKPDGVTALRDFMIFGLMAYAGLRIHEAVELKLTDLHLSDGYIHVFGKGQKHRKVYIKASLIASIKAWTVCAPTSLEGTLITDKVGCAVDRNYAGRRFTMIAETAGVKTTPHAMRHTYIYRYMDAFMAGDPSKLPAAIDAVCQQTGDRPEVILEYYTRARSSEIRAAAEGV